MTTRTMLKHNSVLRPIVTGATVLTLVGALAACDPNRPLSKQTVGAGVGALAGVAIGSTVGEGGGRTAAMIVGGLLGALAGSEIGRVMDENDRLRAAQTTQDALENYPSGRAATWDNPDTGYSGDTVAQPAYRDDDGRLCRRYTQTIRVDGEIETAEGIACRQENGRWRVVSS